MALGIGLLKKRIVLQSKQIETDNAGVQTEVWKDAFETWAAILPLRGKEFFASNQIHSEISVKVVLRYKTGITSGMRVKYGTRFFDIKSVINIDERNRYLELMCLEVV